jgi:hypothetical protein
MQFVGGKVLSELNAGTANVTILIFITVRYLKSIGLIGYLFPYIDLSRPSL